MKKFPTAQLLFTDTDSLCYWISTEKDLYAEIKGCTDFMDFSNYAPDHPNYCTDNQLVPGFFKDEYGGKPIHEFVGLRSKMYSIKGADGSHKSAAKGVSKNVRENVLSHEVKFRLQPTVSLISICIFRTTYSVLRRTQNFITI